MATTVIESKKKKTVRINGCVAAAQAAKYADVDVITAYPIRPYTATMMALAQMVANGELDAEYIVADSGHSHAGADDDRGPHAGSAWRFRFGAHRRAVDARHGMAHGLVVRRAGSVR